MKRMLNEKDPERKERCDDYDTKIESGVSPACEIGLPLELLRKLLGLSSESS